LYKGRRFWCFFYIPKYSRIRRQTSAASCCSGISQNTRSSGSVPENRMTTQPPFWKYSLCQQLNIGSGKLIADDGSPSAGSKFNHGFHPIFLLFYRFTTRFFLFQLLC